MSARVEFNPELKYKTHSCVYMVFVNPEHVSLAVAVVVLNSDEILRRELKPKSRPVLRQRIDFAPSVLFYSL